MEHYKDEIFLRFIEFFIFLNRTQNSELRIIFDIIYYASLIEHDNDICLCLCILAPTASAMQSLLDGCNEYGTDKVIMVIYLIPIKSICTVFKPNGYKLYLPTVFIVQEALKYVSEYKYLGFSFSDSKCDDCDMHVK